MLYKSFCYFVLKFDLHYMVAAMNWVKKSNKITNVSGRRDFPLPVRFSETFSKSKAIIYQFKSDCGYD